MPRTGRASAVTGAGSSVAFTVVVTILTCLGALAILAVLAFSGAPGTLVLATVLAALPVGPLVACYLWLDRYEPEPRTLLAAGAALGLLRRDRGGAGAPGPRGLRPGRHREAEPDPGGAAHRGGVQGPVPRPAAVVAPGRARRRPRRHRVRRHGRHRVRLHREHPLPGGGVQRHRRHGPGRHRGAHRDVRRALPVQPVRAPAVHDVHRHRRRSRGQLAQPRRPGAVADRRLRRGRHGARDLELLDRLRLRRLRADVRRPDGAGVRRAGRARGLGADARSAGC